MSDASPSDASPSDASPSYASPSYASPSYASPSDASPSYANSKNARGFFSAARKTFRANWGTARNVLLDFVVDALSWALNVICAVRQGASAIFTVRWDPLHASFVPIGAGGSQRFVVLTAPSERDRRIVAWFYRAHDAPDIDDWRACLARFGIQNPPPHTLAFNSGEMLHVDVLDVTAARVRRVVSVSDARAAVSIDGVAPIGGLAPRSLIMDARRAARRAAAAQ